MQSLVKPALRKVIEQGGDGATAGQRFVDNQKRLDLGFIPGGLTVELIDDLFDRRRAKSPST
jgi:hypothetical protein